MHLVSRASFVAHSRAPLSRNYATAGSGTFIFCLHILKFVLKYKKKLGRKVGFIGLGNMGSRKQRLFLWVQTY